MIEKRYQVFISSTFSDLQEERLVLERALPSLGCLPVGLEAHAPGSSPLVAIRKMIDDCDYFIVLLGSRYGSLTPSGVSYMHMEYVYASTKQKPILVLVNEAPQRRPPEYQERTAEGRLKFNDFRQMLMKTTHSVWSDARHLDQVIKRTIPALIKARPASGWVRATALANPEVEKELQVLRERVIELEQEREQMLSRQIQLVTPLAQGADPLDVTFRCKAYAMGNLEEIPARTSLAWNDVFLAFAPHLSQMQTEEFMLARINERVQEVALAEVQKLKPKVHAVADVQVVPFSFNTIKVQFRTLGFIRRQSKPGDNRQWWQLTAQGEQQMASLLAVRKGRLAPAPQG